MYLCVSPGPEQTMCRGSSDDRVGSQLHHKQEVSFWQETLLLRRPPCEFSPSSHHPLHDIWSFDRWERGSTGFSGSTLPDKQQYRHIIVLKITLHHCICLQRLHHRTLTELSQPWPLIGKREKVLLKQQNCYLTHTRPDKWHQKLLKEITSVFFSHQLISFSPLLFFFFLHYPQVISFHMAVLINWGVAFFLFT